MPKAIHVRTIILTLALGLSGACGGSGDATDDAVDDLATQPDAPDGAGATGGEGVDAAPELPEVPTEPFRVPIGEEDLTFHVGPYIHHTTLTTVAIGWETVEEGDTVLEYGLDETYGERAEGEAGTMHAVEVTGLHPDTLYHYRACTAETCTGDLTFSTAPSPGRPLRFVVYGDSRSDPAQHRAVVDSIISSEPTVVINTGDVVEDGALREQYKTMHFDPARRLGEYVPLYVAIGNHEWKEIATGKSFFREYMLFPRDEDVPKPGLSYSVRWGDAFFLVLDNTLDGLDLFFPLTPGFEAPLWDWLQEQVASDAAKSARWRFAFFHYPPSSPCHEEWAMTVGTRDWVVPLLREGGFSAIFAGHVHDYERHDYDGLPVFVTGGGGAGLESGEGCTFPSPTVQVSRYVHHHMVVDLEEDEAIVQAVGLDGQVLDSVTLEH